MKRRDLETKNYEGDSVVSLLLSRCVCQQLVFVLMDHGAGELH